MAVIATTWYTGTYTDNYWGTISLGADNTLGKWSLTPYGTNGWFSVYVNSGYRYSKTSPVGNGAKLYDQWSPSNNDWTTTYQRGTVSAAPYLVNTGARTIIVACSAGGTVTSPSVGESTSIVAVTRPTADVSAAANVLTVAAGDATPSTGTLISRGYTAGTWVNWTWPSTVLSSASQTTPGVATAKTITLSLLAGMADATLTANFTRAENSASVWSPKALNIVVHLLNDSLVETESSINAVGGSTAWSTFRAKAFTALSCTAGTSTRTWTTAYDSGAYLMNVSSAVFSVAPITGMRVYGWKLQLADGTLTDFGTNTSAAISGFAEGCKIHLYLTSASPNPRVIYDGFDATGTVPANQSVTATGTGFNAVAANLWASTSAAPVTVTLSPAAWATRLLGQSRSVIVDSGTPIPLANIDGTGASILSSSSQFSLTHVKFKQTQLATDGVLTVTIVEDTITALDGISVRISQENTPLGTLTATGTAGYYVGSGKLAIAVEVDYGEQSPSDFVIRVVPPTTSTYETDVIGTDSAELDATPATRAVTVYVTQKVDFGTLSAVDINLSRTVGVGTQVATSAGPVTQCPAGAISVTMPTDTSVLVPITVECSANAGYRVKTLLVLDATGTRTYYSGAAVLGVSSIYLNIPQANDGDNIKVVLVMEAIIVGSPTIRPMLPDDLGKFAAAVTSVGSYADFRVGDLVTLTVDPVAVGGTDMTGVAIGNPTFNDVTVIAVRAGTSVAVTVTLAPGENVFKIPVYAVLETASAPAGAGTISLTAAWDVEDTLVISAVTYRRIGSSFTVTAPLTSTSPSTYTVISGRVSRRAVAAGFAYVEAEVLLPVVASASTRTFTATLRGPTEFAAVYAIGTQYPAIVFAAYDYDTASYITQGVRPAIATTAVSPATLSDNLIADIAWPETGTPEAGYMAAGVAFLYREITSAALLPVIDIRITSAVASRLEVWNPTTSLWVPYSPTGVTLSDAFTYFRVSVGNAPADLVSVVFQTAVNEAGANVAGGMVYATSGVVYDGNFAIPKTIQARSRSVLHARFTPPYGYIVTGWYIDNVLSASGASLSIIVPDTGLTLKPQLAIRTLAALNVMVLNADPNRTDEGIWVSKLFRAQYPWRPLTAHVIAKPAQSPVTLGVLKDGGDAPEALDTENPGTVAITLTGDTMRRLPPGQIQSTRFVRYMVIVNGDVTVSSVAIGSGADTMKGGH